MLCPQQECLSTILQHFCSTIHYTATVSYQTTIVTTRLVTIRLLSSHHSRLGSCGNRRLFPICYVIDLNLIASITYIIHIFKQNMKDMI